MSTSAEKQPTVSKTDEEWRAQLSPEEYAVLRRAGTERPWTGEYVDTKTVGVYECRACGAELFRSETKFDSHCGWPSFYEASAAEFHVLREAGTERPFVGEYTDTTTEGVYSCRACGTELFRSDTKFESHCGWPSFYAPLAEDRVEYIEDTTMGMKRVEVRCANCGSHMGHVFDDGYGTPTGQRYCINSISMTLESTED